MRHGGVTGGAVLLFLLVVDVMAKLAFKALGVMDACLVPLGRPFVAVGACWAKDLLLVRDGFDIAVAGCAVEITVDGPFLKSLMTIETILRIDRSMKGGTKKEEDE